MTSTLPTPQPGIFVAPGRHQHHLEVDVHPSADPAAVVKAVGDARSAVALLPDVFVVVGFSAQLWDHLTGDHQPIPGLAPFVGVGEAPATQHDLWLWIHGNNPDDVFDAARTALFALLPIGRAAVDQPCVVYRGSRDLTGFEGGTANPPLDQAAEVAAVPAGGVGVTDGGSAEGGSFVLAQRWVHDLTAFSSLPLPDQEAVIGRTKSGSIQLVGDAMPADSHVSRVELHDDSGDELPVLRRSTAYGTAAVYGLYFLAFSADLDRLDTMLTRMFGASGDGILDRLTQYSTPVTGSYYFAPALPVLDAVSPEQV